MIQDRVPSRSEVDPAYTWNAESVFASRQAWEAEFEDVSQSIPSVRAYEGRLGEGPAIMADALAAAETLAKRMGRLAVYAGLSHAVDTTDTQAGKMQNQAQGLFGQVMAAVAFVDPELLAIGRQTLSQWLAQEPRLAIYDHYVDNLFRRQAHVRSAEVEEILGLAADPFSGTYHTFSMLSNADFAFMPAVDGAGSELPLTQSTYQAILDGPDREARRTAWENYNDTYLSFKNSLANNLLTSMRQQIFHMRARNHRSTLEMALFDDNIPVEVYHNLIDTFLKHQSLWHRYWAVRRKALGVDTLHPYDIWAPLSDRPPRITYAQSVEWICQALAPLGQEYVDTIADACLRDRWVDVYPNKGKSSGAFSSGSPGTYPFIMMSYTDDATSLGTLAHELGHSMHSYLAWKNQPYIYGDYTLFAAEVASNFHQAMLRAHLFESDPDPDLQIVLIEESMTNFHRYFLVMPTLARFELEVYQRLEAGKGLTADDMIELHADLASEGYGDEMNLDRQRVGIRWATFPHLYAGYYVFQYATGISAANALAQRVRAGEKDAAEAYLDFLRSGGSMYPLDQLRLAGVDMRSPEPVEEAFGVLAGHIERLETLVANSMQQAA